MARFQRLTDTEARQLTRRELSARVEAEQAYITAGLALLTRPERTALIRHAAAANGPPAAWDGHDWPACLPGPCTCGCPGCATHRAAD